MRWMLIIAMGCLLAGCRSHEGPRSFVFPASRYAEAFDAARDELRRAGYTLERIDSANGELLTAPKTVAGIATPFEPESASVGQMWQDTLNSQPRTVRVTFRDAAGDPAGPATPPGEGDVRAEVEVVLWRLRRPGWRLETESIRSSRMWRNPAWHERGIRSGLVPISRDEPFESEFARRVRDRLAISVDKSEGLTGIPGG